MSVPQRESLKQRRPRRYSDPRSHWQFVLKRGSKAKCWVGSDTEGKRGRGCWSLIDWINWRGLELRVRNCNGDVAVSNLRPLRGSEICCLCLNSFWSVPQSEMLEWRWCVRGEGINDWIRWKGLELRTWNCDEDVAVSDPTHRSTYLWRLSAFYLYSKLLFKIFLSPKKNNFVCNDLSVRIHFGAWLKANCVGGEAGGIISRIDWRERELRVWNCDGDVTISVYIQRSRNLLRFSVFFSPIGGTSHSKKQKLS